MNAPFVAARTAIGAATPLADAVDAIGWVADCTICRADEELCGMVM
jgi:hypothetical protein